MSFDVKAFVDFNAQMDWEGGLAEVVAHGFDSTGDDELNGLLNDLEDALRAAEHRINFLYKQFSNDIAAYEVAQEGDLW